MTSCVQLVNDHCVTCKETTLHNELGCVRCRAPVARAVTIDRARFNPMRSLSSEISSRQKAGDRARANAREPARGDKLVAREIEFAKLLARGYSAHQAGVRMGIKLNTRKGYLHRVTMKAGLPSGAGAEAVAAWARKHFSLTASPASPPTGVLTPGAHGPAVSLEIP